MASVFQFIGAAAEIYFWPSCQLMWDKDNNKLNQTTTTWWDVNMYQGVVDEFQNMFVNVLM